jgi:hypothetical protein
MAGLVPAIHVCLFLYLSPLAGRGRITSQM